MAIIDGFTLASNSLENRPFITLRNRSISFSRVAVDCLERSPFVHFYFETKSSRAAFKACKKDDAAIPFYKKPKEGRSMLIRICSRDYAQIMMDMAGVDDCGKGIRIYGDYFEDEGTLLFDCSNQAAKEQRTEERRKNE